MKKLLLNLAVIGPVLVIVFILGWRAGGIESDSEKDICLNPRSAILEKPIEECACSIPATDIHRCLTPFFQNKYDVCPEHAKHEYSCDDWKEFVAWTGGIIIPDFEEQPAEEKVFKEWPTQGEPDPWSMYLAAGMRGR